MTFLAGNNYTQFDVPIKGDKLDDDEEDNFTLIINPSSLPGNIRVGETDQAMVIIRDNCK